MPRRTSTPHTHAYSLRMDDSTKRRLYMKSEEAGIPLAEAFRNGAELYLDNALSNQAFEATASAWAGPEESDDDDADVLAEFRAAAAKVERRLSGR